jgi:DNA-binding NarL/FixJ family response regulator
VSAQVVILLWTLRRLQELSNIRERMSRLADGLALLTDTTEAGLAAIVHQIEQAGRKASKAPRPASRTTVAKRVVAAVRNGERVTSIAEHEALSESEVRLHLAMSERNRVTDFTPPLAS